MQLARNLALLLMVCILWGCAGVSTPGSNNINTVSTVQASTTAGTTSNADQLVREIGDAIHQVLYRSNYYTKGAVCATSNGFLSHSYGNDQTSWCVRGDKSPELEVIPNRMFYQFVLLSPGLLPPANVLDGINLDSSNVVVPPYDPFHTDEQNTIGFGVRLKSGESTRLEFPVAQGRKLLALQASMVGLSEVLPAVDWPSSFKRAVQTVGCKVALIATMLDLEQLRADCLMQPIYGTAGNNQAAIKIFGSARLWDYFVPGGILSTQTTVQGAIQPYPRFVNDLPFVGIEVTSV